MIVRQITLAILALMILVPGVEAKRKKSGTGSVKDGVYTDAEYGFQIGRLSGWDAKPGKKGANLRFVTTDKEMEKAQRKKNDIPKANPVLGVPTAALFVFETGLSPTALIDSVLALGGESVPRKEILEQTRPDKKYDCMDSVVTQLRSDTEVDGRSAKLWTGSIGYHPCDYPAEQMEKDAQDMGRTLIPRFYGVILVCTQMDDNHVLVFAAHCDRRLTKETRQEALELIKWFKWAGDGQ